MSPLATRDGHWESAKVSHRRVFALLTPEIPHPETAQMLQKPVFALPGCQPMSVNTLLCDTLGLDEPSQTQTQTQRCGALRCGLAQPLGLCIRFPLRSLPVVRGDHASSKDVFLRFACWMWAQLFCTLQMERASHAALPAHGAASNVCGVVGGESSARADSDESFPHVILADVLTRACHAMMLRLSLLMYTAC